MNHLNHKSKCEWCGSSDLRWVIPTGGSHNYNDCVDCGERTASGIFSDVVSGGKELFVESWRVLPYHAAYRSRRT